MVNTVFPDSVEPAYYPGTTTLVNLLGLSEPKKIRNKEADFTAIRSIELFQKADLIPQTFDFNHLKAIHRHLFQDIYEWAGKLRPYDIISSWEIVETSKQVHIGNYKPIEYLIQRIIVDKS